MPGVSRVQITFQEDGDPLLQPMPPGGFRLAIVNCWDLDVGLAARDRLRACFPIAAEAEQHGSVHSRWRFSPSQPCFWRPVIT